MALGRARLLVGLMCVWFAACEDAAVGPGDTGPMGTDAGSMDAEPLDATPSEDGGPDVPDATTPPDAGRDSDAVRDGGPDGRVADTGTDAGPPLACMPGETRECGEGMVVGGTSRCVRGIETCDPGGLCNDDCDVICTACPRDGECDDGREGSETDFCNPGTDCSDCGPSLPQWGECDGAIEPLRNESCNDIDDDCDGMVDEELTVVVSFADTDGDGAGDDDVSNTGCNVPPGFVLDATDCEDDNPDVAPGRHEVCNGIDDDCDGLLDPAGEPCSAPATPSLLSPWNGYLTGSSRRPTFRWETVDGVTSYQVQLDDSCDLATFRTCTFPTPELDQASALPDLTPGADLPVAGSRPVGRRYYWRVRACLGAAYCSNWSEIRYLDVGRVPGDFDGDGFADVAIGANGRSDPEAAEGAMLGIAGSSMGPMGMARAIDHPDDVAGASFGSAAASGDIDADGFSDLVVGAPHQASPELDEGQVYLLFGSLTGLSATTAIAIDNPSDAAGGQFGASIAMGDLDGDGYADIVVGAPHMSPMAADEGVAFAFAGGPRPIGVVPMKQLSAAVHRAGALFGATVAVVGDLRGDGLADLVVAAPEHEERVVSEGRVYVYDGARMGLVDDSPRTLSLPRSPLGWAMAPRFGRSVSGLGDGTGDGLADIVVGAWIPPVPAGPRVDGTGDGAAFVFRGNPTSLPLHCTIVNPDPDEITSGFGEAVSGGFLQGGNRALVVVGAPDQAGTGAAVVFEVGSGTVDRAEVTIPGPAPGARFGESLAVLDTNADGFADLAIGAPAADTGRARIVLGASRVSATSIVLSATLAMGDRFGTSFAQPAR